MNIDKELKRKKFENKLNNVNYKPSKRFKLIMDEVENDNEKSVRETMTNTMKEQTDSVKRRKSTRIRVHPKK